MVAACVTLFIVELYLTDERRGSLLLNFGTVPIRLLQALHSGGWSMLLEFERLITGLFLHGDWPHLLGNMAFLMIFGFAAERTLGPIRFLSLFILCGALANLAGALMYVSMAAPIVGSSGAVSAIVGAYITLFPRARLGLVIPLGAFVQFVRIPADTLIALWILIQFLFVMVGPEHAALAWPVHIAGFISGVAFAFLSRSAIARRLRNN